MEDASKNIFYLGVLKAGKDVTFIENFVLRVVQFKYAFPISHSTANILGTSVRL